MKTVGLVAGSGRVPAIGVRVARQRGWQVVAVAVADGVGPELERAGARCVAASFDYGRVVEILAGHGVRDLYIMGKIPKLRMYGQGLDEALRQVISSRTGQGDHRLIDAFIADLAARGIRVCPQWELLGDYLVPAGFSAGRAPSAREWEDIRYGYRVARLLADGMDAGQTAVVKEGIVLALEAAEGTDATIRRGGTLGGPGAVVVKVKGARAADFEVPAVGEETLAAMEEVGAAVLAVEAGRTLLVDRDELVQRAQRAGIALLAVEESEE
ncbi:MAG: UDP-2,3-diacylglucosamine diphosphatase LpxI [Firmicutes bacterium]|nr:UDP-2,3-diacylglucosamine diphosphatase LpxI [Bacillota bacterium]